MARTAATTGKERRIMDKFFCWNCGPIREIGKAAVLDVVHDLLDNMGVWLKGLVNG